MGPGTDPAPMSPRATTKRTATLLSARFGDQPFSLDEATYIVGGARQLRNAVAAGLILRLRRGWYVSASAASPAMESADSSPLRHLQVHASLRMALERLRDRGVEPVRGGDDASNYWGLHLLGQPGPPMLLVPPESGVRPGIQGGVLIRHAELPPDHVTVAEDGTRITTRIRTGIDCARSRDPLAAFMVLNSAVRESIRDVCPSRLALDAREITRLASEQEMRQRLEALMRVTLAETRGRGLAVVRAVLHLMEPRLETALESLSWWRFDEAEMPLPVPQQWVVGASGREYRVDFDADGVVGEADGSVKYATRQDVWAEKTRQSDIELGGRPVVRWVWQDMWRRPHVVIRGLRAAAASLRKAPQLQTARK